VLSALGLVRKTVDVGDGATGVTYCALCGFDDFCETDVCVVPPVRHFNSEAAFALDTHTATASTANPKDRAVRIEDRAPRIEHLDSFLAPRSSLLR
jgi:hypothetical protein